MKNENNIDNYFSRVKQNPPLMNIEKVHQIITEVEAKTNVEAKAEAKKGYRNLLTFTIMTTILAIFISAVLLWTDDSDEIIKSNEQIPNRAVLAINLEPLQESKEIDVKSKMNESSNTDTPNSHSDLFVEVKDQNQKSDLKESIQFKVSNYAICKNRNNVSSDFEMILFDKDVFEFDDKNNTIWLSIISDQSKSLVSGKYSFSNLNNSEHTPMSFSGQYYIDSNFFFKIIDGTIIIDTSKVNHSVVYELILENHQKISGKYQPKPCDREGLDHSVEKPKQEYVYPEQILDSTLFIELDQQEFMELGFTFENQTVKLNFLINEGKWFLNIVDSSAIFGIEYSDKPIHKSREDKTNYIYMEANNFEMNTKNYNDTTDYQFGITPMLVTNENGVKIFKLNMPEENLKNMFSKKFEKDFKTLLPVVMKRNTFDNQPKGNFVFWFLPTDEFFNRLPKGICNELLNEYNYITAEDKSALVQPVCKYFDECKNTLKVSNFKVYPNPASANATVSFTLPEAINGRITLVDLAGHERQLLKPQTSYAKGQHSINVDLNNVPEGIYLLTLYTNKGVQTQRVIVAR